MKKKVMIVLICIICILIVCTVIIVLNKEINNVIPEDYIASVSYPYGEGSRTIYIYAEYDEYTHTQILSLVVKYSYIELINNNYREPEKYTLKREKLKDIDEVISLVDNVKLNINSKSRNIRDDSIKKEYKKGDYISKDEFREILENEERIRMIN